MDSELSKQIRLVEDHAAKARRDDIAVRVLIQVIANQTSRTVYALCEDSDILSRTAYKIADAMMKARGSHEIS